MLSCATLPQLSRRRTGLPEALPSMGNEADLSDGKCLARSRDRGTQVTVRATLVRLTSECSAASLSVEAATPRRVFCVALLHERCLDARRTTRCQPKALQSTAAGRPKSSAHWGVGKPPDLRGWLDARDSQRLPWLADWCDQLSTQFRHRVQSTYGTRLLQGVSIEADVVISSGCPTTRVNPAWSRAQARATSELRL